MQKLIDDKGWGSAISNTPRFVTKVVYKFYANLSDNIVVQRESQFEKILLGAMSMSFPLELLVSSSAYLFLKIFSFENEHVLNDVGTEMLRYKCAWPKTNVLMVVDIMASIR